MMKKIVSIFFFFSIVLCGCKKAMTLQLDNKEKRVLIYQRASIKNRFIILKQGESNAKGYGDNDSLSAQELSIRHKTKILYLNKFVNLDIGTNNGSPTRHGWECGIANSVDSGTLNSPVYIVNTAVGGTKISDWDSSGVNFKNMTKILDTAKKLLTAINGGQKPRIFVFYSQGENDKVDGVDSYLWKSKTINFIDIFRAREGQTPFFMTLFQNSIYATYNLRIREICEEVPECFAIETEDCLGDGGHWYPSGLKKIATRMVCTMKKNYQVN